MIKLHRKSDVPPEFVAPLPARVVKDSQPPAVYHPLPPTAARSSDHGQAVSVADVKMLVKQGLSDEVIINQIRSSRTVYRLTTADIIELKESGVSDAVIDCMINTRRDR